MGGKFGYERKTLKRSASDEENVDVNNRPSTSKKTKVADGNSKITTNNNNNNINSNNNIRMTRSKMKAADQMSSTKSK